MKKVLAICDDGAMIRFAALSLVVGMVLCGQGLRFRLECQSESEGVVEEEGPALEGFDGEVLVSEGMSLWRGKNRAILIRPKGEGREMLEMNLERKTWKRSMVDSVARIWEEFRSERGGGDGHEVQIQAKKTQQRGGLRNALLQGVVVEWKSSREPRPIRYRAGEVPRSGTPQWLEENTREIGITIESWVDQKIQMPGLHWEQVGWGLPEFLVQGLFRLMMDRAETKNALGGTVGLAMETKMQFRILGEVRNMTIRVVDVKAGAIDAGEFAIPEGFREEK